MQGFDNDKTPEEIIRDGPIHDAINKMAAPKFKTLDEVKEAYRTQPPQAGQGERPKGNQIFYVPICSKCGDYTWDDKKEKSKMYGTSMEAYKEAVRHVKEYHAASQ